MIWSAQQEGALRQVSRWRSGLPRPYFTLAGYAGTGKTTLAKQLASGVGGTVYFAAYTGKAAHVLRKTGIPNASTIHQLIYLPRTKCDEHLVSLQDQLARLCRATPLRAEAVALVEAKIAAELRNLARPEFTLNSDSPLRGAALLVIDEYSMVDRQTGHDLLSFNCPVLALGDPGQLPPVQGTRFFDGPPDCMLTEIHRQAADNPIIRLSKEVREGRRLKPGTYGTSRVVSRADVSDSTLGSLVLGTDQLLVGLNETRRQFNRYARQLLGRTGAVPVRGDKLVCLRNNHQDGLLNGQTWTVDRVSGTRYLRLGLLGEDGERVTCLSHPNHFEGTEADISHNNRREANEFDYGYALTVHKSQGSQWDSVVLLDEWRSSNRAQWLYTGITRAAESITVIQ
jgi:exodeoxyribonuclease-5